MDFGRERSSFEEIKLYGKRDVEDKDIGKLIKKIMKRCIKCNS
jgi:NADH dehydrogenase/NADH:ubiquinone oxidoreductase subunit G